MMMHPSYKEMIEKINAGQDMDEAPLVTSRYSIVIAAAKRARQLIGGDDALVSNKMKDKPLSVAVRELYEDQVHILPKDAPDEETLKAQAEEELKEEYAEEEPEEDEAFEN